MRDAKKINNRSIQLESYCAKKLIKRFGEVNVHIQEPMSIESSRRWDFVLYLGKEKVYIDIFYAKDRHSLVGSIISKRSKLKFCPDIYSKNIVYVYYSPIKILLGELVNLPDNVLLTNEEGLFSFLEEFLEEK